jgi:DNA-binding XRE family transcriptional regulator
MRINMSNSSPADTNQTLAALQTLGVQLRAQRKALKVNATVAAEAAGMSRVTLHRIEKGEPSVAMGAWANVAAALGMQFNLELQPQRQAPKNHSPAKGWWPVRIVLADYPQLKALAWQVQGTDQLTPVEAHDIYERNARHINEAAMSLNEQELRQALQAAFGKKVEHV